MTRQLACAAARFRSAGGTAWHLCDSCTICNMLQLTQPKVCGAQAQLSARSSPFVPNNRDNPAGNVDPARWRSVAVRIGFSLSRAVCIFKLALSLEY